MCAELFLTNLTIFMQTTKINSIATEAASCEGLMPRLRELVVRMVTLVTEPLE